MLRSSKALFLKEQRAKLQTKIDKMLKTIPEIEDFSPDCIGVQEFIRELRELLSALNRYWCEVKPYGNNSELQKLEKHLQEFSTKPDFKFIAMQFNEILITIDRETAAKIDTYEIEFKKAKSSGDMLKRLTELNTSFAVFKSEFEAHKQATKFKSQRSTFINEQYEIIDARIRDIRDQIKGGGNKLHYFKDLINKFNVLVSHYLQDVLCQNFDVKIYNDWVTLTNHPQPPNARELVESLNKLEFELKKSTANKIDQYEKELNTVSSQPDKTLGPSLLRRV